MNNYTWAVSPGGTITSGGTLSDSTVTVTWNISGPQMVSVNYIDPDKCNAPSLTDYPVSVDSLPSAAGMITGITPVCAGTAGVVYSVVQIPDINSYVWTTPAGVNIISGQNTDSIIVNITANATSGEFTVYGVNGCGNGPVSPPFSVIVNHHSSVSAGPDTSTCEGTSITIQQSSGLNYTGLIWTTTGLGTIVNGTTLHPTYNPSISDTGDVVLTLTAFSAFPCPDDSSGMIIHYGMHPVVYAGADQTVCNAMPFTVTDAHTFHCSAWFWTGNGQGQIVNATTLSPTYNPAPGESGNITLTLHGFGTASCQPESISDQMILDIHPPVLIQSDRSDTIPYNTCDTLSVLISGGSGDYQYNWEPGSLLLNDSVADPITINLVKDTIFILLLKDKADGCSATDSIRVHLVVPEITENCIVVHNVVTPNGDGLNDHWVIDCIENYPENKVEIFNRWGSRINIFTNYNNIDRFWKGTDENGQPIPDGTYYYVIKIPNAQTFSGWVLVRGGPQ
jgi:gliding motility-associated-like protein